MFMSHEGNYCTLESASKENVNRKLKCTANSLKNRFFSGSN